MPELMDLIDGRYRVQDEIGRGGMGVVLRVLDTDTGDVVALKYCVSEATEIKRRFDREVRVMSSIQHHNIMPILNHNLAHSPPYFTMPIAAHSIEDELEGVLDEGDESGGAFGESEALEVFKEVCRGVQAVHNGGATHRDIKPANVMRMSDQSIVVSDMGLAKLDPRDTTVLTQTGVFLGTRIYSAPEQWGGSRDVDERADVYQLGKVLYQLLTGDLPLLIDREQLPSGLDYIVERATMQHPDRRYQSVGALMDAIESYIGAQGPEANLNQEYEAAIQEAQSLAENSEYRLDNLQVILELVRRFSDDPSVFLEQLDRVPVEIMGVMARRFPEELAIVLDTYAAALAEEVSEYSFTYAEVVARRMRTVFDAGDTTLKVLAMKATLIAAVVLHRYAAMGVFDAMLVHVSDSRDAVPIADMLREQEDYYEVVADRVPRNKLHVAIRAVYDDVQGTG